MLIGSSVQKPFIGSEAYHLEIYQQYAGDNAELWELSETGHCGGPTTLPEEYAARMIQFFDTAFDIERR